MPEKKIGSSSLAGRDSATPPQSYDVEPHMVSDSSAQTWALRDPDVRLMVEVRGGSTAAFEELMRRYQNRVATVLFHLVRNRDLAEDLTQEVFLRVFRARQSYRPGAKFSTWLFTITHNVGMESLRRRARRHETRIEPDGSGPLGVNPLENLAQASSSLIPSRAIDKAEARNMVHLAIESLNERQRMAVLLCRFEGMSYADIAQAMGVTSQAVKSLLSRARCNPARRVDAVLQGRAVTSFPRTDGGADMTRNDADRNDAGRTGFQFSKEFDEKLTAYLDGELDTDAAREMEDLIAENSDVRRRVQELDRAWDMLESLQPVGVDEEFTRTTVELVQLENDGASPPRRSGRFRSILAYLSIAAVCFVAGFGAISWITTLRDNRLLRDLPVVERLDAYLQVESIDFLRELRDERLFAEEEPDGRP